MLLLLATASTFGVCGSAYSAQPDSQIRQAESSTIVFFVVFALLTLLISFWAARRATNSSEYLTAGSSISSGQNGLAIAGDYMSAGAFLGLSGAIYASGLDGMFLAASYLASWPIVLFLVAEPLRRLGKYSFADVLTHKLRERPISHPGGCFHPSHRQLLFRRTNGRRRRAHFIAVRNRLRAVRNHGRATYDRVFDPRRHASCHMGSDHQGDFDDWRKRHDR